MDSPGWFDSGYVVPGDTSDDVPVYAGEKIYVNYDMTRTKYGDVIVDDVFTNVWYHTGYKTAQNYSIDINLDNTKTKYGDTVVNDVYTNIWYLAKTYSGTYRRSMQGGSTTYETVTVRVYSNYNNTRSRNGSFGKIFEKSWTNVSVVLVRYLEFFSNGGNGMITYWNGHNEYFLNDNYELYLIS